VWLSALLGLSHELAWEPGFVLTAQWRPWVGRVWRYSTTVGRGIVYHPDHRDPDPIKLDTRLEQHERVHVRQVEDRMALAFFVGLAIGLTHGLWWTALIIWWSGGAWQLPNFITAGLRFGWKHAYEDSEHERSAYAQTDMLGAWGYGSWWELRAAIREADGAPIAPKP
jgi:hypothetical protein